MSAHAHPRAVGGQLLDQPMLVLLGALRRRRGPDGLPVLHRPRRRSSNMTDGYPWGIWEPLNVVVVHRHRRRRLRRRPALLHAQQRRVPPARPAGGARRRDRATRSAAARSSSPSAATGTRTGCRGVPVLEPQLGRCSRSRSASWPTWSCSGSRCCRRSSTAPRRATRRRVGASARSGRRGCERRCRSSSRSPSCCPTMHQSSLGGLMLIAGPKLHPLWHTRAAAAAVPHLVPVDGLRRGGRARERPAAQLERRAGPAAASRRCRGERGAACSSTSRCASATSRWRGKLRLFAADFPTFLFARRAGALRRPRVMFLLPTRAARTAADLFGAALLACSAGALYRLDTYLTRLPAGWLDATASHPAGWDYFPSLGEISSPSAWRRSASPSSSSSPVCSPWWSSRSATATPRRARPPGPPRPASQRGERPWASASPSTRSPASRATSASTSRSTAAR